MLTIHVIVAVIDFSNTRVRLQRVRDAKFFNGWVTTSSSKELRITTPNANDLRYGDVIVAELNGREGAARISGVVSSSTSEVVVVSIGTAATGSAPEEARIRVTGITGTLRFDAETFEVFVLDASEKGVGILTQESIPRGSKVSITIAQGQSEFTVAGEVRYSKPDPDQFCAVRVWIRLNEMQRLDRNRWMKLIETSMSPEVKSA